MVVRVRVDLGGGLELLFGGRKAFVVDVARAGAGPSSTAAAPHDAAAAAAAAAAAGGEEQGPPTVADLLSALRSPLFLQQRPELFLSGDTVRPGILVLINDADWELEGHLAYELKEGDEVSFISTLHGG